MGATFRRLTPTTSNLEISSLVWLDGSVNTLQESIDAKQRLRLLINHLETFESPNLCEQYIKSLSELDRIILIVSGFLGHTFVPKMHQYRQIVSIYVYCGDKQKNELWTKDFTKVRGLAVNLNELINQIRSDQAKQQHSIINEPLTFTTFKKNNDNTAKEQLTVGLNGQFIHSQLLIDCLLQIKCTSVDKNDLIAACKQEYQGDDRQLELIRKFENGYSSDEALQWYTRDAFVYRMLNKALRTQNIPLIFLFRFLIRDLETQLKDNQCSNILTVYRGQLMWTEEFEILKHSAGQLISINSFLSTSRNRDLAYSFLLKPTDLECVLFEIEANPRLPGVKSFANITALSHFPEEQEVLFMLGSIFKIISTTHDRNGVWTIKLTLCSDNDLNLKAIFDHMKSEDKQGGLGLVVLGDVLRRMGRYTDAEKYYRRCLDELPFDDYQNISICHYSLGHAADSKGDYDLSLKLFHKSLEIDIKTLHPDDPGIAHTHNSIGNVYQTKGDYKRALESYNKALAIFRRALGEGDIHVGMCLNNLGAVYQREKKYLEALNYYENALTIRTNRLPPNHPDLGASHNNIGIVQRHLGHSDQALEEYNVALSIYKISLPPQHSDIAMTLENIGIVYEEKRDWEKALFYYKDAEDIYHQTLPTTHSDVLQIEQSVQRMSSKLK